MTVYVHKVGRVRIINESTFCTEVSEGTFEECPVVEDTPKLVMMRPFETPKIMQQHIDGYPSKVPMPRSATFGCTTVMRGTAVRGTTTHAVGNLTGLPRLMWHCCFGAVNGGTGTTIASTSTTTVLNVTSAAGLSEGGAIVCATGTGGALECREIKTVSSNVVTTKLAFSSIPANGSTVYSCYSFYLGNLDGSSVLSLQTIVEGLDTTDRWLLKGGAIAAPPVFKLAPGTLPTVDWSWQYADHKRADGSETTMNLNSALADQAYSDIGINAIMDSEFRIFSTASSTLSGTDVHASEINITPNIAYEPHRTPGGTNTIKQWVRTRVDGPAVTGDFVLPYESVAWRTARDSETSYAMTYQVGSGTTNGGFMISVPSITVDDIQREAVGGLAGQRVKWYAKLDAFTTTNSSALQKSAMRVHFF